MLRSGTFFLIFSFIALSTAGCPGRAQKNVGEAQGRLEPCPKSPNCVSTKSEDPDRSMNPLPYFGTSQESQNCLVRVLRDIKRCTVVTVTPAYLHVEFRSSLFRFVDDVEFLFDDLERMIHFRSASRKGYYDFGVNRKRMKDISDHYLRAGEQRR
jgi:uncharacterized protein (DUF1499 family)